MENIQIGYLAEKISKVPSLVDTQIYVMANGHWQNTGNNTIDLDSHTVTALGSLSSNNPFKKFPSPSRAIFLLKNLTLAVSMPVTQKTRNETLIKINDRLNECLSAATSSFHAHYDELTNVLNRHGIRHLLQMLITDVKSFYPLNELQESQLTTKTDLVLYSFDIDRFKSVNDSLGHASGDIVLVAFSSRLKSLLPQLEEDYAGNFILGRPGGEEFELIGVGSFSLQERARLGAFLLQEIRKPLLSSLEQIQPDIMSKASLQVVEKLSQSCGITASIGLASRQIGDENNEIEELHSVLRKEADAALYRAKADGRNCLRIYDDIRLQHGRVVEYFPDSELVQIDIGTKVGVTIGDSFIVAFPPYTGGEVMLESPKSLKVLGTYPEIESSRIRVIAIQKEVSTCEIFSSTPRQIPIGSRLKYLHSGSRHIISSRANNQTSLGNCLNNISNFIQELQNSKKLGAVCLLDLLASPETKKSDSFAEEISVIVSLFFPPGSKLFYSLGSNIYVVVPSSSSPNKDEIRNLLKKTGKKIHEIVPGALIRSCIVSELDVSASLSADDLIFYCNTLRHHVDEKSEDSEIENVSFFDEFSPIHTMHAWRLRSELKNLIADYQQFREAGMSSASLHNQFGLAVIENEVNTYFPMAEFAFREAVEMEPKQKIFAGNLGVTLTRLGKFSEGHEVFQKIESFLSTCNLMYQVACAKCGLEVYRSGQNINKVALTEMLSLIYKSEQNIRNDRHFIVLKGELCKAFIDNEVF